MNGAGAILIIREEIVCVLILTYLAFISRAYRMGKDGRRFNLILSFAMLHVIMDAFTVITVNRLEATPVWVNALGHWIFYLSALMFSAELFRYVLDLCYPELHPKWQKLVYTPVAVYALLLFFVLKIEYHQFRGTWASDGPAPMVGYAIGLIYFITAIGMLVVHWNRIGRHIRYMLTPMLLLLIIAEIVQIWVKEFLFTGGAVTAITVAFFFTLENPAAVLERKVMMDVISGLGTRSGYEHDMVEYEKEFLKDKSVPFIFVFIDINNLRSVNGLFGHQEGDSYISEVAVLLMTNLKNAEHIYRMGGDEFLAIYRRTEEKTVIRDIRRVHEACRKVGEKKNYMPELAIGYAVSDVKYTSLRDVLRVSDYMMYRNKTDLKREAAMGVMHDSAGTHLNLSGLTDRVFDAMCLTSEGFYPYMTNLETNVTRVSPAMVEFFGLPDEFMDNFSEIWNEKVHPDDLEGYYQDLREAMKGNKAYHYYRYRAKSKNGEYVEVSCRGGLYHGRDGEPDIFSGYIINHGAPEMVDPATGLRNHAVLFDVLGEGLQTKKPAILVRTSLRNINRIRALYGYKAADSIFRSLADMFRRIVGNRGEVFSRAGLNFTLYLPGSTPAEVNEIYHQIREYCSAGVMVGEQVIPVGICAGAVQLPSESLTTVESIRGAALFAMEEAQNSPQDRVMFYSRDVADVQGRDIKLLQIIHRDCLKERRNFYLRLQPIIRAQTGEVTGAEALLRWKSPTYGEISPARFIAFLENDPGYSALGYDIIRHAVREARRIREKLPTFRINVNITALQLCANDFIPMVLQILAEENYPPDGLILELTERCKEMEFSFLKEKVAELRKTGIRVALDDMGTGFSTIDLLLHLPVDEVKLDMEFTASMQANAMDSWFAGILCEASTHDSIFICFEGVETQEMRDHLKSFGDVLLQGYYFDRPMLPDEFRAKYCQ